LIFRLLGSVSHVVCIDFSIVRMGFEGSQDGREEEEERSAFGGRGGGAETNHFANERCFFASAYGGYLIDIDSRFSS
jgi:uncharacterized MAPEG superfamily protein